MSILVFSLLVCALMLFLGLVVDRRDKTKVYDSGSDRVQVLLPEALAIAVTGDPSAQAGWYIPSYQESTQIGPERESEEIKSEADVLVKVRTSRDEFVLVTTFFQTDDTTLALLDALENTANAVRLRYPMPTQDPLKEQWVFGYSVTVRKEDWRIEAARAADRTRQATFVFSKDGNGDIREIVTLPLSQADPAWDDYVNFKDAATP